MVGRGGAYLCLGQARRHSVQVTCVLYSGPKWEAGGCFFFPSFSAGGNHRNEEFVSLESINICTA